MNGRMTNRYDASPLNSDHMVDYNRTEPKHNTEVNNVFHEFADNTSMHGVPRIINARSMLGRIFWSLICAAAFGMFMWQTAILLARYYSYPKKVNVEIVQRPVKFPSVSLCSSDHLDMFIANLLEQELMKSLQENLPIDDGGNGTMYYDDVDADYTAANYQMQADGAPVEKPAHADAVGQLPNSGGGGGDVRGGLMPDGLQQSPPNPQDRAGATPEEEAAFNDKIEKLVSKFRTNYQKFSIEANTFFFNLQKSFTGNQDMSREYMLEAYSRLGITANLGLELSSEAGINLKDFIISCKFMDKKCNQTLKFKKFFDMYFFNCYTFTPDLHAAARLQGVEYGLSLQVFTGTAGKVKRDAMDLTYVIPGVEESDPALASGRGARVIIHGEGTQAHPSAEGFDIPPGFSVTIGVRGRENVRISQPHGNCTNIKLNGTYKYTLISCQNKCIQSKIMQKCGCVDNRISLPDDLQGLPYCLKLPPYPPECQSPEIQEKFFMLSPAEIRNSTDKVLKKCVFIVSDWARKMKCRKDVYVNMTIIDPDAMDHCECYPPCQDIVYDAYYSLSTLPGKESTMYHPFDNYLDAFPDKKIKMLNKMLGSGKENHSKALSRLNVHIADSNVIKTTEEPDYVAIRLVSDIGGQLGLWIGISVITIFEAPDYEPIRLLSDVGGQLGLWIGLSVITLFEVIQLIWDLLQFLSQKGREIGQRQLHRVRDSSRDLERPSTLSSRDNNPYSFNYRDRYALDKMTTV